MNTDRRKFLRNSAGLTAAGLVGNLGSWGVQSAQAAGSDFKAAVCLFFFGGNDSNNLIVPIDDARWADYSTVRTVISNIALTREALNPITDAATGAKYGLHPNLVNLANLYTNNKMAMIANAGTLLRPLTMTEYKANQSRPSNLYSHSDQQVAWMGQQPNTITRTGWGGRASDRLASVNKDAMISPTVSVSGNQIFTVGNQTMPFVIPGNGGVTLKGQNSKDPVAVARYNALRGMLGSSTGNAIVDNAAVVLDDALDAAEAANPVLTATLPGTIAGAFVDPADATKQLNTGIAQQLKQVARLIESRQALGLTRQFFFVSMGGFDTHSALLSSQVTLMKQIDDAVSAFYNYTVAAGVQNQVTTFSASDFNRTFIGNANAGTDHAYGGHHFALGGAVNGGRLYGTFPTLAVKGPDDVGNNGAWLPTTGIDQIGATIASWLGVSGGDMPYVFPNINNYSVKNLGFV